MSENNETPTYSNKWLIPYLNAINATGDEGMSSPQADEVFPTLAAEDQEAPSPSKIRQTMYIAKLARKDKAGNLFVTDKGQELIANGE